MSLPTFKVNKKPNGHMFRVTVESSLQDLTPLTQIQNFIKNYLPDFEPKDASYIHLTLLHLGIPTDIYFELRRQISDLTLPDFNDKFHGLLQCLHHQAQHMPQQISIHGDRLDVYGSRKNPAVALKVIRTPELDSLHQKVFVCLFNFLAAYQLKDVSGYISNSRNFRHSPPPVFNPHITLGRLPNHQVLPELQSTPSLTIRQPRLAQVTVI